MAHRIVKESFGNGKVRYVVQTNNGWFGIKSKLNIWSTETYHIMFEKYDAIFSSFESAKEFCEDLYFDYNDFNKQCEIMTHYGLIDENSNI